MKTLAMRPTTDVLFEIGDRVRLSKLGEVRVGRTRSKVGTVVGFGYSEARVRVLFDRLSQPVTLHRTYLIKEQKSMGGVARSSGASQASARKVDWTDRVLISDRCAYSAVDRDLCTIRALERSYSLSGRPVMGRRASGTGRSASPATGTGCLCGFSLHSAGW